MGNPSESDLALMYEMLKKEIGPDVAKLDTIRHVYAHNPDTFWGIYRASDEHRRDAKLVAFISYLPLNEDGYAALQNKTLTGRSPNLAFIAKAVTHNGRDLEGALNRLLAHSKLTGQPVTLEMAEREVRDLIRPQEPKRVKIEDIQRVVARQYNVSRADLLSSRRTANVVRPRQVAMYLAKTMTLRSLPEIGRRFGGRDHTTVLHAVRKIENLVGNDNTLAEEIELLKRLLQE